jgi:hypothetical protein
MYIYIFSELRDLLKQSDEMPVFMEEAVMLRCQLQALEWANKAALVLPLASSLTVTENYWDDDLDQGGTLVSPSSNTEGDIFMHYISRSFISF